VGYVVVMWWILGGLVGGSWCWVGESLGMSGEGESVLMLFAINSS